MDRKDLMIKSQNLTRDRVQQRVQFEKLRHVLRREDMQQLPVRCVACVDLFSFSDNDKSESEYDFIGQSGAFGHPVEPYSALRLPVVGTNPQSGLFISVRGSGILAVPYVIGARANGVG